MNNNRTLYARNAFAAAAVAFIGSVSALPAQAQDLSRGEVRASVVAAQKTGSLGSVGDQWGVTRDNRANATSNVSRAQVHAAAQRAVANGEVEAQLGDSYGYNVPATRSVQTRAEVREATIRALHNGNTVVGDSYGYASPAKAL